MQHVKTQTIETNRLILRRFTTEDAQQMFDNWAGDANVTRYLSWAAHPNPELTADLLHNWVSNYECPDYYNWCIVLKENHQAIGSIGAVRVNDEVGSIDLGYCLGNAYKGKGIMTEAVCAANDFFFTKIGAQRIQILHDVNNPASGRVAEKCGMTYEGTFRRAARDQQGICDVKVWSILADEYAQLQLTNGKK